MTDHTTIPKVSRLEVIETGARRRWTTEEKLRIVAESEARPRQVSATARRYGLSPALLFTWRRLAREGQLGGEAAAVRFAPAVLQGEVPTAGPNLGTRQQQRIEIVLADGVRVIGDAAGDTDALARLVSALERR